MALSVKEQLDLLSGNIAPPETDFLSLVLQTSAIEAHEFYLGYKEFDVVDGNDEAINTKANLYLQKILRTCDGVFSGGGDVINLGRVMTTIMAKDLSIAILENATQSQWETFIKGKMFEAFELFSKYRKDEKTAYDTI